MLDNKYVNGDKFHYSEQLSAISFGNAIIRSSAIESIEAVIEKPEEGLHTLALNAIKPVLFNANLHETLPRAFAYYGIKVPNNGYNWLSAAYFIYKTIGGGDIKDPVLYVIPSSLSPDEATIYRTSMPSTAEYLYLCHRCEANLVFSTMTESAYEKMYATVESSLSKAQEDIYADIIDRLRMHWMDIRHK